MSAEDLALGNESGYFNGRPFAFARAIATGDATTRGVDAASTGARYIQTCFQILNKDPEISSDLGNLNTDQGEDEPQANASIAIENDDAYLAAAGILPSDVLRKFAAYKAAQNALYLARRRLKERERPLAELTHRVQQAIGRLQQRMFVNRQWEMGRQEYDHLGQRMDDLCHCLATIDRNVEREADELQDLEVTEARIAADFADAFEKWLVEKVGVEKALTTIRSFEFVPPFDVKIVSEAEIACDQQTLSDEKEIERLQNCPIQNEERTSGRTGLKREAYTRIIEAKEELQTVVSRLDRFERYREDLDAGRDVSRWRLPDDPSFDLVRAIELNKEHIDYWVSELKSRIQLGRELQLEVTDEGSVPGGDDFVYAASSGVAWGLDAPDDEVELTTEEIDIYMAGARAKVEKWCSETDLEILPESIPGTPRAEAVELADPTPEDSTSNVCYGTRFDFGYSIYRNELDEMERLREIARAQLPPEAKPAADGPEPIEQEQTPAVTVKSRKRKREDSPDESISRKRKLDKRTE